MRKPFLTLIILLCMAAAWGNTVYAAKTRVHHKAKQARYYFDTDSLSSDTVLKFAQSLIGTRYRSASSDPLRGFDCSGFVSYVFKNFSLNVPRSSSEFINAGEKIRLEDARPGDVILFTGTKKHSRKIGHVGIIFFNDGNDIKFIHSTSGKEHGVTITAMDATYRRRYVQVVRLLKTNDDTAEQRFIAAARLQGY